VPETFTDRTVQILYEMNERPLEDGFTDEWNDLVVPLTLRETFDCFMADDALMPLSIPVE